MSNPEMNHDKTDDALPALPYRIAALCYLFDERGRVLLLHRIKPPNRHLYSPIGGKLEQALGESPAACAQREIMEEAGVEVAIEDLHLTGIVSESSFEDAGHWLMFLYEVTVPVSLRPEAMTMDEGFLEWFEPGEIENLSIPETDRQVIWPLFWKNRGGFFAAHINCEGGKIDWRLES